MKPRPEEQTPCHSSFPPGSFALRDHLRSNLGIISGLGIICGRGSFAGLYSFHSENTLNVFLPTQHYFGHVVVKKNLSDGNPMVIAMLSISQFFLFEACFQKGFVNFRDQLVRTVHLTVEIKLCFQIPPS